ncbi:MAG: hypothetical protein U0Q55_04345 [Vicinamibacterales bacterium]
MVTRVLAGLALVCALFIATACNQASPSALAAGPVAAAVSLPEVPGAPPPIRVAVIQDKTVSGKGNRTPQIQWEHLQSLIDAASTHGGEVAFGIIHPRESRPLVRLRVTEPPTLEPEPMASNPLEKRRLARKHAEWEATKTASENEWLERQLPRVQAFSDGAQLLLRWPADGQRSAVWAGVRRAVAFLAEPAPRGATPPRKFLLVSSDGDDDTGGVPVDVPPDVTVLLVSGNGDAGQLESLGGERYESIEAACAAIAAASDVGSPTASSN